MMPGGALFEVKAYLIYLAALVSVVIGQLLVAIAHRWAWLNDVPPQLAVLTGIPTFGGAPGYIHAANLMLWSLPGIVSMRWILGLVHGRRPAWWRVLAGYLLSGILVFSLVAIAEVSLVPANYLELAGIVACLTAGYAVARLFVLAKERSRLPAEAQLS